MFFINYFIEEFTPALQERQCRRMLSGQKSLTVSGVPGASRFCLRNALLQ
jgi:hypothetical protein